MSDDYATDDWLQAIFGEYYDPCPLYGLEAGKDGLSSEDSWNYADYDGVFINPPYSKPKPWVKKAIDLHKANQTCIKWTEQDCDCFRCRAWPLSGDLIVLLLKHDSSTEAYRMLHEAGAHFLLINGRLRYKTNRPANFPSMLAVLSI